MVRVYLYVASSLNLVYTVPCKAALPSLGAGGIAATAPSATPCSLATCTSKSEEATPATCRVMDARSHGAFKSRTTTPHMVSPAWWYTGTGAGTDAGTDAGT